MSRLLELFGSAENGCKRDAKGNSIAVGRGAYRVVVTQIVERLSCGKSPCVFVKDEQGLLWHVHQTYGRRGNLWGLVEQHNVDVGTALLLVVKRPMSTKAFMLTPERSREHGEFPDQRAGA